MKYFAVLLAMLLTSAASPAPAPMSTKVHATAPFHNPGSEKTHPMNGQGCVSGPGASRAAMTVNPVNGHAQAATIVSVPITKGGSVANSTTRAQQAEACAHTH